MQTSAPKTQKKIQKIQVWIFVVGPTQSLQVLLFKTTPARGGFWQPVTGKVEDGESFEAAALREVAEETGMHQGLTLIDLEYHFQFKTHDGRSAQEQCYAVYLDRKQMPMLDAREHVDFLWTTSEKALEMLKYDTNRQALQRLLFHKILKA